LDRIEKKSFLGDWNLSGLNKYDKESKSNDKDLGTDSLKVNNFSRGIAKEKHPAIIDSSAQTSSLGVSNH